MHMRRLAGALAVIVLAAGLGWAPAPSLADDRSLPEQAQEEAERAREVIEQALGRLIAGLKLVMDSIPQYEAPEILENGDILIRRKRPATAPEESGQDI